MTPVDRRELADPVGGHDECEPVEHVRVPPAHPGARQGSGEPGLEPPLTKTDASQRSGSIPLRQRAGGGGCGELDDDLDRSGRLVDRRARRSAPRGGTDEDEQEEPEAAANDLAMVTTPTNLIVSQHITCSHRVIAQL